MLRIFRGERPAAAGAPEPDERETQNTISLASGASRPAQPAATSPEQPASQTPGSQTPGSETPGSQTPGSETSGSQAPGSQSPGSEAPPASEPGFLARGNIRRRARFLRAARELAYRDLGGLVFDLHRFGQGNDEVLAAKLATLGRIDAELRALEEALKHRTPITVLRRAGVSACPRCAAIHGSFDRFCPACGLAVQPDARPIAPTPAPPPPSVTGATHTGIGVLGSDPPSTLERHASRPGGVRVQQPTQAFDPPTQESGIARQGDAPRTPEQNRAEPPPATGARGEDTEVLDSGTRKSGER